MRNKGQGGAIHMLLNIPWFIYLIILFIVFSAYMAYRAVKMEKMLEQHYIEREGQIYMERIKQERLKRQQANTK
mgnify:CR=1 FL=1